MENQIPIIKHWRLLLGSIEGKVYGRPGSYDGKVILTSKIDRSKPVGPDLVVHTVSGSVYKLDNETSNFVGIMMALFGPRTK